MKKLKRILKKIVYTALIIILFGLGWYGYDFYREKSKGVSYENNIPTLAKIVQQDDEITKAQEAIKEANSKLAIEEQKIKDAQKLEEERHNKVIADEKIKHDEESKRLSDEMDRILAVKMSFSSASTPAASSTQSQR